MKKKPRNFGMHTDEIEINGRKIELQCKYIVPGYTVHDLVQIFDKAKEGGNDLAGNPTEWKDVRGVIAVVETVLDSLDYEKDEDFKGLMDKINE